MVIFSKISPPQGARATFSSWADAKKNARIFGEKSNRSFCWRILALKDMTNLFHALDEILVG